MELGCPKCGASLRLNPNLAGTTVSCPRCAARVQVPEPDPAAYHEAALEDDEPEPEPARPAARRPAAPRPRKTRPRQRYTFWLLGVQATLVVLGLSCLLGAFFKEGWNPPEWSYFHENGLILLGVGVALLCGGWVAQRLPVVVALAVVVCVLLACSWHFVHYEEVDASRTLALGVAMLALWLALQHRRACAG